MTKLLVLGVVVAALATPTAPGPSPCWRPPVDAVVVDPFRPPTCPWCPGNRGIEYATPAGTPIHAVASGTVSFSGTVAGTTYVVVALADGKRITYGNLADPLVSRGERVVTGQGLGRTAGRFHFGVRLGDHYLDPDRFLGVPRYRVRLLPIDGSRPVSTPSPRWVCPDER
ncbi:MAG: peptidase [Ilumatobacter coccineus]|uniref:Peptidase n=1 Tax=Ilumatobacter coccineus TaxID=467094 RepID=A0A2G6KAU2_9ACTN|nr:MAG: peptidase [Ilumatobacter coccineus]